MQCLTFGIKKMIKPVAGLVLHEPNTKSAFSEVVPRLPLLPSSSEYQQSWAFNPSTSFCGYYSPFQLTCNYANFPMMVPMQMTVPMKFPILLQMSTPAPVPAPSEIPIQMPISTSDISDQEHASSSIASTLCTTTETNTFEHKRDQDFVATSITITPTTVKATTETKTSRVLERDTSPFIIGKRKARKWQSTITCGFINDQGKRQFEVWSDFFGRDVQVFTASLDPKSRILYRVSDLKYRINSRSNNIGMYFARRRVRQGGIYQATDYIFKTSGRNGLKAGSYFASLEACQKFEDHTNEMKKLSIAKAKAKQENEYDTTEMRPLLLW